MNKKMLISDNDEKEVTLNRKKKILAQRVLATLNFNPGPVDGVFGPETRKAI